MSEFSFGKPEEDAFIEELRRREYDLSEISEVEVALRMFKGFLGGDEDFDVLYPGYEAPKVPPPHLQGSKAKELLQPAGSLEDSYEAEIQVRMQAISDEREKEGWLPIPHFVRDRMLRPEAEAMVREARAEIDELGGK